MVYVQITNFLRLEDAWHHSYSNKHITDYRITEHMSPWLKESCCYEMNHSLPNLLWMGIVF